MFDLETINNIEEFIYTQKWIKYRLYSSINYKVAMINGAYIIINQKDDYLTGKPDFILMVYIEPGIKIDQIKNLKVDLKKLKFIDSEIFLHLLGKGDDLNEYGVYQCP